MATNNGYVRLYIPSHANSNKNGLLYEHQIIAERLIGRKLRKTEVVHHIDGNKKNNNPNNLLVFASNSDHVSFHHQGTYTIDSEGVAHCKPNVTCKSKPVKDCPLCGDLILKKSKYCEKCGHFVQRKVKNRPNREELKRLIRTVPFIKIASLYGVSDNAIRKWCKSENLPCKTSIIKNMPDDEWQKI